MPSVDTFVWLQFSHWTWIKIQMPGHSQHTVKATSQSDPVTVHQESPRILMRHTFGDVSESIPKEGDWKGDCPGGAQHHLIDWRLRPTQLEKGGRRKSAKCQHPPLYFLLHGDLRKPQGQFQPIQSQLLTLLCHDRLCPLKPWANIKPSCLKLLCQSVSALRRVTDRTPTSLHIHRDRKDNVPNTLLDITHISPGHSHSEHDAWC